MDHLILPSLRHKLPWRGFTVFPGSASYTTPGTYYLTVPAHRSFSFDVRGAGGGGAGAPGMIMSGTTPVGTVGGYGGNGGHSQVYLQENSGLLNAIGWGGTGGNPNTTGTAAHGTAQGGDSNITGGGSPGGAGGTLNGSPPSTVQAGGYGGRSVRGINAGLIWRGQTLVIVVGSGGPPGSNASNSSPFNFSQTSAGYGANGAVYLSWS